MVVSEESQKAVPPNNPPPPAGKTTDSAQDAQASEMPANLQEVLSHPLPSAKPTPLPALTPEQTTKYLALIEKVLTWTEVPTSSQPNSPTEPISRSERMWLTRECLLRYLRASKWSVPTAATRLLATLTWRHEYGLNGFTADYISPENETGKQVILGYDVEARPCLYLIPARQNTTYGPRQLHHLVYMLERTIDLMGPGQENVALLINYKEMSSGQQPPLSQGKQTMHILQNHYPERLGRSFIINLPWFMHAFFKLITPFIDPVTRLKLKFNEGMSQYVSNAHLLKPMGGDLEFDYDHSIYWPALTKLAAQRHKEQEERWIRGGERIGELETYLKGGQEQSLKDLETKSDGLVEKTGAGLAVGDGLGAVKA